MKPDLFGSWSRASVTEVDTLDKEFDGKHWHGTEKNGFEHPFDDEQERSDQVTLSFLDRQRRLNRYDVKAVSTLSKLYKKIYSIK